MLSVEEVLERLRQQRIAHGAKPLAVPSVSLPSAAEARTILEPGQTPVYQRPAAVFQSSEYNFTVTPPYKLRKYQVEGVEYLRNKKRAFLCDKPGLGKTPQAACAAEIPVLIAAPTYLTWHWYSFLKSCGVTSVVNAGEGTREQRQEAVAQKADWTIINIEMLRSYTFDKTFYTTFIVDEAHHLRGRNSQQTQGAKDIAMAVPRLYLLTATPAYTNPDDVWSQLNLISWEKFPSYWGFVRQYCNVLDTPYGPKLKGLKKGAKPKLRETFDAFALTRTYSDVSMQLPPVVDTVITVPASEDFMSKYKSIRDYYVGMDGKEYETVAAAMHALRRSTLLPKLKALASLMQDTNALTGTVILCWYKDSAQTIASLFDCPCIDGDMTPKDRFEATKNEQLIVATIASLSEGVDLSHMHTIIYIELDYVPGRLFQSLKRVHRWGQKQSVNCYYINVAGTIDEIIFAVKNTRTATINEIVREALVA